MRRSPRSHAHQMGRRDLLALLWPGSELRIGRRRASGAEEFGYLPLPSFRDPRLLVPEGVPAAAAMLRRQHSSRRDRAVRSSIETAVRLGVTDLLPVHRLTVRAGSGPTIESHLADVLGQPVLVGVMLGPPRANAKPVLRVFDTAGSTVAFAKISANGLTRDLLSREAMALKQVNAQSFAYLRPPRILHHGTWQAEELLVLEALPIGRPDPRAAPPLLAMTELSRAWGTSHRALGDLMTGPLAPGTGKEAVGRAFDSLACSTVEIGSWHGDWSPWNMSVQGSQVLVWDWERFETKVPLGFDAVHFVIQQWVANADESHTLGARLVEALPRLLEPFAVPVDQQAAVAALYIMNVLSRYHQDGGTSPTSALRRRTALLNEALGAVTSMEGTA